MLGNKRARPSDAAASKPNGMRPMPDASEETWPRRKKKFYAGIEIFKNSEYDAVFMELRLQDEVDMSEVPRTPDRKKSHNLEGYLNLEDYLEMAARQDRCIASRC